MKSYTPQDYITMIGQTLEKELPEDCVIIFFGSVLTDRFNRTSDIDVAVFCKEEISPLRFTQLQEKLENLPMLRDIDLVDIRKQKNIQFLQNILKGKVWKSSPEAWKSLREHIESLGKR